MQLRVIAVTAASADRPPSVSLMWWSLMLLLLLSVFQCWVLPVWTARSLQRWPAHHFRAWWVGLQRHGTTASCCRTWRPNVTQTPSGCHLHFMLLSFFLGLYLILFCSVIEYLCSLKSAEQCIHGVVQWCTTLFGQGPHIDFLNPSGARRVRRLLYVLWIDVKIYEDALRS